MALTEIKEVDRSLIEEIVRRILRCVEPEKIILFGSYAYGEPREGSDLDILVVMESDLPRYKRSIPIYRALAGLLIPKDIIVYTPDEIEAWSEVDQAFITTVAKKGRVVYAKNER
jgi:predicted nucleotidyltransferase